MTEKLGIILDYLMRPGVEYNQQKRDYWGVRFHKKSDGTVSAIVASAFFAIEVENVDIKPEGEFFYYRENTWGPSPYPNSADHILSVFDSNVPAGHISVPLPNLVNHIGKLPDDTKKKSRIIFSPGKLDRNDVVLRFSANSAGRLQARNPRVAKPFEPVNDISGPGFSDRAQFYKCRIVEETEHAIMVEVIDIYGKVRIGINCSPHGFVPDDMTGLNDLIGMPRDLIYGVNQTMPQAWVPLPYHFDCMMLFDLLKVCMVIDAKMVDMFFGYEPNQPIIIRSRKESEKDPQISIAVASLNQNFGDQRR